MIDERAIGNGNFSRRELKPDGNIFPKQRVATMAADFFVPCAPKCSWNSKSVSFGKFALVRHEFLKSVCRPISPLGYDHGVCARFELLHAALETFIGENLIGVEHHKKWASCCGGRNTPRVGQRARAFDGFISERTHYRGSVVAAPVVDDNHFEIAKRLPSERIEKIRDRLRAVLDADQNGKHGTGGHIRRYFGAKSQTCFSLAGDP